MATFLPPTARAGKHRILIRWPLIALCVTLGLAAQPTAAQEPGYGKVLIVRGLFTVFSLGLDELAARLKKEGADVEVVTAAYSTFAVDKMCQEYASGSRHGPIVLVGHSLGGDLLPSLAKRFESCGLRVSLMVMVDSTNPSSPPPNVVRCVNLYQSNMSPTWFRVFRGAPITAANRTTEVVNVDIRELPDAQKADSLDHFNIEESPWIHDMIVRELQRTLPSLATPESQKDVKKNAGGNHRRTMPAGRQGPRHGLSAEQNPDIFPPEPNSASPAVPSKLTDFDVWKRR